MKFSRLMVLLLLVLAVVITCVACDGGKETTKKRTTSKTNDSADACAMGEHVVADDAWVVDREASCRVPLREVGICSNCGAEVERKGEKLDHDWGEVLTEESTCQRAGATYHKCSMCQEEEMIEELPIKEHEFTEYTDSTGKFVKYNCDVCQTNYIKAKPTSNDLFYWATNEVAYEALASFDENFGVSWKSFNLYTPVDSNNTVCAMVDGRDNSYLFFNDKNNILKNEDDFVIQFDIMYEKFPEGSKPSTLLCLPINNQSSYVQFLTLNSNGYLGFVDETAYESPIKGGQLSLNTWHNIAVVVSFGDIYKQADSDSEYYRLPYDVYLDGKKLDLDCEITKDGEKQDYSAERGAAGWGSVPLSEIENLTIRIADGGRNVGLVYDFSIDNFRVYTGTTVQPALRGELDFGAGGKVTVNYPKEIIWE